MSSNRKRSNLEMVLSSFDSFPRQKPIKRSRSDEIPKAKATALHAPELEDIGIVRNIGKPGSLEKVLDTSQYAHDNLFDPMPERRAGMNSTRTAQVLNFRINVPPLITTSHVHAVASSPSAAERQIASLIRSNTLRRINIPLRGQGAASVSDMLISVSDIERLLRRSKVDDRLRKVYLTWLKTNPFAATLTDSDGLTPEEIASLRQAGFLTSAAGAAPLTNADAHVSPLTDAAAKASALSSVNVAAAASGSAAAVGGHGGSFAHGGGGAAALQVRVSAAAKTAAVYQITVPNCGAYLKLLVAARSHLVDLLKKASRSELPLYLLEEYWNAGLTTKKALTNVSKDPFEDLMPGQTKKWKSFYGMKFEWAFEEAFGGGLIECFDTRSVGLGVRLARR